MLLLAGFFLEENRARMGLRSLRMNQDAQKLLVSYSWPGNVRELEHLISRATLKALSSHAERPRILTIDAYALGLDEQVPMVEPVMIGDAPKVKDGEGLKASVDAYQKVLISDALIRHEGKWVDVARELGLDRANLSRLARRLGIR